MRAALESISFSGFILPPENKPWSRPAHYIFALLERTAASAREFRSMCSEVQEMRREAQSKHFFIDC